MRCNLHNQRIAQPLPATFCEAALYSSYEQLKRGSLSSSFRMTWSLFTRTTRRRSASVVIVEQPDLRRLPELRRLDFDGLGDVGT